MAANSKGALLKDSVKSSDRRVETNLMFSRIIGSNDVTVKSQQRTDTDLTNEQKMEILRGIFEQNPRKFLSRFGPWISIEDLRCFCASSGSEMEYEIGVLKQNMMAKTSAVCVKNRRYEALHRLEKDTNYFSEEEMRQRCPLLYEQYIGQYMTDQEKLDQDEIKMEDQVKMSAFIFQQIDRDWLSEKEMEEREAEECIEEEDDSDNEDNNDEAYDKVAAGDDVTSISPEDKLKLRYEFQNIMRQRFLEGLDDGFDYTKVDMSDEYDNLDILGQDSEDKYFDEEEPEIIKKVISNGFDTVNKEQLMAIDSGEEDYLSDKILEQCCASQK